MNQLATYLENSPQIYPLVRVVKNSNFEFVEVSAGDIGVKINGVFVRIKNGKADGKTWRLHDCFEFVAYALFTKEDLKTEVSLEVKV